jgi:hypothetical protein
LKECAVAHSRTKEEQAKMEADAQDDGKVLSERDKTYIMKDGRPSPKLRDSQIAKHSSAFSLYPTVDPVSLANALNISIGCLDALYVVLLPSKAKLMSTEILQLHAMTTYLAGQTS